MGHFRSQCLLTGCLALFALADPAWAKKRPPSADQVRDAAEAFDRGRSAFRSKGYVEAAENFEAADGYAPSAQALLLAMKARLAADHVARALTLAELALALYGEDDAVQAEARKLVETHASDFGKLNVTCDEACELLLDGKLVHGRADTQRTIYVDPGMHRLRASWADGSAKSLGVRIDAGGFEILNFEAPSASSKAATDAWLANKEATGGDSTPGDGVDGAESERSPGRLQAERPTVSEGRHGWSPVVFWTGIGLTGAGVITSTALGVRAIVEPGADRVAAACGGRKTDCPEYQEGVRNQTAASISIGVTAGVAVLTIFTGLVLTDWQRGKRQAKESAGLSWQPIVDFGEGFRLGARGTF